MTTTTTQDLRILICEDEYLLAMDMAQQLTALGAEIVGMAGTIAEIERKVGMQPFDANAAILDIRYPDGLASRAVELLHKAGVATVICSGYSPDDGPPELKGLPWVTKPAHAEAISRALCDVLDARTKSGIDN